MVTFNQGILPALSVIAGAALTIILIVTHEFTPTSNPAISSDVQNVGRQLVSYGENGYALPFELVSVLLLAAMVGSIIAARKERLDIVKKSDPTQE